MPETNIIVINTAPLISLIAAIGDLIILQSLYTQVWVPFEVCQEILSGGVKFVPFSATIPQEIPGFFTCEKIC
ncbi:hypothetical protein [Nostoc sp. UHCC 0302]|uniref:hypothetical protein n=1 Tax=Nostoc sp. UHCC 0302 TaxID=3134896 RepID=UPI00311C982B